MTGALQRGNHQEDELAGYVENLHFDEAWLPHAAFHPFYEDMHAIGPGRKPCKGLDGLRHTEHAQAAAGPSQASQILVQDAEHLRLDLHALQRGVPDAHLYLTQYAIIASCDVAAAMMEQPGGGALVEESISRSARLPTRDGEGRQGIWQGLVVQDLGTDGSIPTAPASASGSRPATSGMASAISLPASTCSTRSRRPSSRRGWTSTAASPNRAFPHRWSPSTSLNTAWWSRRRGLYSFFVMFTIGIIKGRWNSLVTELQQFKMDYDQNIAVARDARVRARASAV